MALCAFLGLPTGLRRAQKPCPGGLRDSLKLGKEPTSSWRSDGQRRGIMPSPHPICSAPAPRSTEHNLPWLCWLILPLAAIVLSGIAREWADFVLGLVQR